MSGKSEEDRKLDSSEMTSTHFKVKHKVQPLYSQLIQKVFGAKRNALSGIIQGRIHAHSPKA